MLAVMVSIGLLFTMVWHVSTFTLITCTIQEPSLLYSFQLICVDELKSDYRNPMDFCKNLNRVIGCVLWYICCY